MPTLYAVRYVNLRILNTVVDDFKLNFRAQKINRQFRGSDCVVLGKNGVGKTSLISLIFSVIRPLTREFLRGGDRKNRKLADYLPKNGTSHILLLWVADYSINKEPQYFLTGMAIENRSGQPIQLFYSVDVSNLPSKIALDFHNFPIYDENGAYHSISELKSILKTQKGQAKGKLNYMDGKNEWQQFLASHYDIDPELFRIQTRMNQREAGQASMINFGNYVEFIVWLVTMINPFDGSNEEEANLKMVVEHFNEIRLIPVYKLRSQYNQNLLPLLIKMQIHQKEKSHFYNEVQTIYDQNLEISQNLEEIKHDVDIMQEEISSNLNENSIIKEEITKQISYEEDRAENLKYQTTILRKRHVDQKIEEFKKKINNFSAEAKFLFYFDSIRELESKQAKINELSNSLQNQESPLEEKYEKAKQKYGVALYRKIFKIQKSISEKSKNEKYFEEKIRDLRTIIDQAEIKIEASQNQIKKNINKINKIDLQKQKLITLGYIAENSSPDEAIVRLQTKIKQDDFKLNELKNRIEDQQSYNSEFKNELTKNQTLLEGEQKKQKDLIHVFDEISKIWSRIINHPCFDEDKDLVDLKKPIYSLINQESLEKKQDIIRENLIKIHGIQAEIKKLSMTKVYVDDKGTIPPEIETRKVLDYLNSHGVNAIYGWEYLLKHFQHSPTIIENWAKSSAYLLEGIVIITPQLAEVQILMENFQDLLQSPIYISNSTIFINSPNSEINSNTILLYDQFQWKLHEDGIENFIENMAKQEANLSHNLETLLENTQKIEEYKKITSELKHRYPSSDYEQFLEEKSQNEKTIESLIQSIADIDQKYSEIELVIEEMKNKKLEIKQKIKSDKYKIHQIQIYQARAEEYDDLQSEITKYEEETILLSKEKHESATQLSHCKLELRKIKEELKSLTKQDGNYEKDTEKFIKKEKREYTKIAKLELWEDGDSLDLVILHEIYIQAKKRLNENPDIKKLYDELENVKNDHTREYNKVRIGVRRLHLSVEDVKNYYIEHVELSSEEIEFKAQEVEDAHEKCNEELNINQKTLLNLEETENQLVSEFEEKSKCLPEINISLLPEQSQVELNKSINCLDGLKREIIDIKATISQYEDNLEIIEKLTNSINNIRDQIYENIRNLEKFNPNLLKVISTELNLSQRSKKNLSDIEIETDSIERLLQQIGENIHEFYERHTSLSTGENQIFSKIRKYGNSFMDTKIKTYSEVKLMAVLESNHHLDIDLVINQTNVLIQTIQQTLQDHEKVLSQIVDVFTSSILSIFDKLYDLAKTKIRMPENELLHNKFPIKIDWGFRLSQQSDRKKISEQIRESLILLGKMDKNHAGLQSYEQLIKRLIEDIVKPRVKKIEFLIPQSEQLAPEHREMETALKASGGETSTIAVLLYCLIAHYRMLNSTQTNRKKNKITSSSFIMDNPFGNTNRPDLIGVQLALARALHIQIIAFTGLLDTVVLDQYHSILPIQRFKVEGENEMMLDVDKTHQLMRINGDSITRKIKTTIDSQIIKNKNLESSG
ncbi:hypothetical protein [Candidatus Lokiarchaeum ossiferum]|uniref:hypothetical protein n=1 Tax=Candidatus Lokiarchaeum ossiferum TaxID=2951803 RepID=UPI00352FD357